MAQAKADWTDQRPVAELPFGAVFPEDQRDTIAGKVRDALAKCGAEIAEDINRIGCTTLHAHGVSVDDAKVIRLGMGGSGVGLPCFVGLDRYCLIHDTIGGLQEGQAQRDAEQIPNMTRELTIEEKSKIALIESARRTQGKTGSDRIIKTVDFLRGREGVTPELRKELERLVPEGAVQEAPEGKASSQEVHDVSALVRRLYLRAEEMATGPERHVAELLETAARELEYLKGLIAKMAALPPPTPDWLCPDHKTTVWSCRFCVAAALVNGPFTPELFVLPETSSGTTLTASQIDPNAVEETARKSDKTIVLAARVARWRMQMARD